MKNNKTVAFLSLFAIALVTFAFKNYQQVREPWTAEQLMAPSELAEIITSGNKSQVHIFSVGPAGLIRNSIETGEAKDKSNITKLKDAVSGLPKDAHIVIYCGCCPFQHCPNVRPAFSLLNDMGFTNHKLLNLAQNLKVDWIDKGYPVNE